MSSICDCSTLGTLTTITKPTCVPKIIDIKGVILQRRGYTWEDGVTGNITLKADWDTLIAAIDSTKVISLPKFLKNPVIETVDPLEDSDGNNVGGATYYLAENKKPFSGGIVTDAVAETQIRELTCYNDLTAYFVTYSDQIMAKRTNDFAAPIGTYTGFNIESFRIGTKEKADRGTVEINTISFLLEELWSSQLEFITPETGFSPYNDIILV